MHPAQSSVPFELPPHHQVSRLLQHASYCTISIQQRRSYVLPITPVAAASARTTSSAPRASPRSPSAQPMGRRRNNFISLHGDCKSAVANLNVVSYLSGRMARQRIGRAQHTERGKKHGGWQQKESNRAPTASDAKIPSAFHSLLEPCRAWRNGACCRQGTMKLHVFTDFRSKRIRLYWSHAFLVHDYKLFLYMITNHMISLVVLG